MIINLLSGNPERYSGRLLCTKNGNPDWDSERSYSSLSVLRGAGVPVINECPEPSADHVCCAVN